MPRTQAHRHTGIQAHRHTGIQAYRLVGKLVGKLVGTRYGTCKVLILPAVILASFSAGGRPTRTPSSFCTYNTPRCNATPHTRHAMLSTMQHHIGQAAANNALRQRERKGKAPVQHGVVRSEGEGTRGARVGREKKNTPASYNTPQAHLQKYPQGKFQ